MNEKYHYTGINNKVCPVCGSTKNIKSPVIYFVDRECLTQHKWCVRCFETIYRETSHTTDVDFLLAKLTEHAHRALNYNYEVKGFFIANVPAQGLTLVMELKHE